MFRRVYCIKSKWTKLLRPLVYMLLLTCSFQSVVSQNLVPNPSFELFEDCPPYPGQIHLATDWDAPNNKTTDYFHRCSPFENGASVPTNLVGTQEPFDGNAYAGIRTWIPTIEGNPIYREYLSTQLLNPLEAGQKYEISFMLSLAETSGYLSNDIGLYIATEPVDQSAFYDFKPQLSFQMNQILEDTKAWQKVSTVYTAQGGEQYLILGNFLDDEKMERLVKDRQSPLVYYYIDYVEVNPCLDLQDINIVIDTVICEEIPLLLSGTPEADSYQWDNGSKFSMQAFVKAGSYKVVSDFGCYEIETTYNVSEQNCDCDLSIPSPQLAQSTLQILTSNDLASYQIQVFNTSGQFLYQLDNQNSYSLLLASGIYYWKGQIQCGRNSSIVTNGRLMIITK